jgi:hypothetical protein
MTQFVNDIRDLVDIVRRCYPTTELFCWHTAPLVSTDNRNPHWYDKRPNVVAALNAAGRFVAKEKGLCLLDWDLMFQVSTPFTDHFSFPLLTPTILV